MWAIIASMTSCSKPTTAHNRELRYTSLQLMAKDGDTMQYRIDWMPKIFTQDSVTSRWSEFEGKQIILWRGGKTSTGNRYANFWVTSYNYVPHHWFSTMVEFNNGTRWVIIYSRPEAYNYPFNFGRINVDAIAQDLTTSEGIAAFSIMEFLPGRQTGWDVAEGTGTASDDPHILWTIDTLDE